MIKKIVSVIILCDLFRPVYSQNAECLSSKGWNIKYDEAYGKFERNKFDVILPEEKLPHGLVIFIHGGGFKHGDKNALYERKDDIAYFLENNIAVATINYRFYDNEDSLGVKVCLQDIQRAIQYIRFNASIYNIDKCRIGCYGTSAGAGASLFFAFHDDMAISGDTTLLGESTRIKCAGAIATQSTYNVFAWKKIIPWMRLVVALKRRAFNNAAANFYGYPDYKGLKKNKREISSSLDMLNMIDSRDPPVYLMNLSRENFPINDAIIQHHKKHAVVVSKKLNKHNVENYLYTSRKVRKEQDADYSVIEFLVDKLK